MSTLSFVKMHGSGNDFVMVDDRAATFPVDDRRRLSALAARATGVGCEGVVLLQRSARADFRMRFFNPDGSEAFCGNGARCVAAFAYDIGAVRTKTMTFASVEGDVAAELLDGDFVRVAMPAPRDFADDFVVAGVPHKIVPVADLAGARVAEEGRRIRFSDAFAPAGTNVDFVTYCPPHGVSIRTYERGVEAETGACGTGACAAAVIGVRAHGLSFPVRVRTRLGYELTVDGVFDGGTFGALTLAGPVKRVFRGEIDLASLEVFGK